MKNTRVIAGLAAALSMFLCAADISSGGYAYEIISSQGVDLSSLNEHGGTIMVVADAAPGHSDSSEAHLTFRPYGNEIELWSWGAVWENCGSWLWDIEFSDITIGEMMSFPNGVFSIDPAHIYQIDMSAEITIPETEEFGNGVQAELYFYIIPEPASLLLLGLGGLLIRRK
jgi:hypothetical protein